MKDYGPDHWTACLNTYCSWKTYPFCVLDNIFHQLGWIKDPEGHHVVCWLHDKAQWLR